VAASLALLGKERSLRRRAVDSLGLEPGATVLDLGCGTGANFAFIEGVVGPGGRLIAVDYSEGMLGVAERRARSAGWGNVELVEADAARMELPPGSLDGALATLALSAIPDQEAAVRNVHRALKPNARFAVLDARLLEGPWRLFNPLIRPLFVYTTNWNPDKDVIATIGSVFGSVDAQRFNAGSAFVAVSVKSPQSGEGGGQGA
jgi:demethylmenaquinone methyltransferase/2-methoxy-6-polyprenyl-1,4-benzoquinol methylase